MAHMSLYRKYRPDKFSLLVGQQDTVLTLTNQLLQKKLSHAYMFIGTRGTGKTSTAKILAKAVNCLNLKENGDPCNSCESCRSMEASLDVIELDAASNNGVDEIRKIVDNCAYVPANNKYKVYIIDEVHMLSKGAFNALLKTLEEPPSYVIFILCTTELNKVPATIRSRCIKFEFKRISVNEIIDRMQFICGIENKIADSNALKLIAINSDGAMRDALSMLEQAFYLSDGNKITEDMVISMLGSTNKKIIIDFVTAIFSMNPKNIISSLDYLLRQGKDVQLLIQDTMQVLKDCMLVKATEGNIDIEGTSEYKSRIVDLVDVIPLETILYILELFNEISYKAKYSTNPMIVLQSGLMSICIPTYSDTAELASKVSEIDIKLNEIIDKGTVVTREMVIQRIFYENNEYEPDAVFTEKNKDNAKTEENIANNEIINEVAEDAAPIIKDQVEEKDVNKDKSNEVKGIKGIESFVMDLKNNDMIFATLLKDSKISYSKKKCTINTIPVYKLPLEEIFSTIFKNKGFTLEVTI